MTAAATIGAAPPACVCRGSAATWCKCVDVVCLVACNWTPVGGCVGALVDIRHERATEFSAAGCRAAGVLRGRPFCDSVVAAGIPVDTEVMD